MRKTLLLATLIASALPFAGARAALEHQASPAALTAAPVDQLAREGSEGARHEDRRHSEAAPRDAAQPTQILAREGGRRGREGGA